MNVLLAGDVTYDRPALHAQREQGFIAEVEEHRRTLPRVLALVRTESPTCRATIRSHPRGSRRDAQPSLLPQLSHGDIAVIQR